MIYGRFHSKAFPNLVTVLRPAVLDDVKRLEGRRPDKIDKQAIELGSYVVVREEDGLGKGKERLYHIANLRADNGWTEISDALEATKTIHASST